MILFKILLRIAGPIAADLPTIAAQRCAMAGIIGENGAEMAARIGDNEKRQVIIHRAALGAAVGGKISMILAPGQSGRTAIFQSGEGNFFELVNQLSRVAVDVGLITLRKAMKTPAVPSKTLGYLAAALPIVTAVNDESDARRIVDDARAGINVSAGEGEELARAIESVWRNELLATEYGENGRRYGLEHFGIRQAALKYLTLIDSAAQNAERLAKLRISS